MNDQYDKYGLSPSQHQNDKVDHSSDDQFADYPVEETSNPPQQNQPESVTPITETQLVGLESHTITTEALLSELERLIGLQRVKTEINTLLQYVRVQELRRLRGIAKTKMSLHSVFYGSPGTGKTTVARLYGKLLNSMGFLSKGHLVETDRSGLVGNYVGQTATKTDQKIREALGGILFIDEAYSLSKGEQAQWDYGSEAIEVLVKRMEDYRDDLVIIVAGYPEPMDRFLKSNEGLKSRFSTYIHFDDYKPEEMLEIFQLFCQQENYEIDEEGLGLVRLNIEYHYTNRDKSFGNARYVRNLFELITRNHALRIGTTKNDPTVTDLQLIFPEDVPFITDADM